MIAKLKSLIRRIADPGTCGVKRSPRWSTVRDGFLVGKTCAACGGKRKLAVHHRKPFHLHPELELDLRNLIVLCGSPTACHFVFGHLGSWRSFNAAVDVDAADHLKKVKARP